MTSLSTDKLTESPWIVRFSKVHDTWRIEPTDDSNGGMIIAEFCGPDAEKNAREVIALRAEIARMRDERRDLLPPEAMSEMTKALLTPTTSDKDRI